MIPIGIAAPWHISHRLPRTREATLGFCQPDISGFPVPGEGSACLTSGQADNSSIFGWTLFGKAAI